MSIRMLILLMGLCGLLVSCSTNMSDSKNVLAKNHGSYATNMGVRYLLGRGVKQEDEKAFFYFNQAAISGDPFAQNEVAYLYAAGKGTPRNLTMARHWYQKAAAHGLASAQYNLGLIYLHGLGVAPNKTKALNLFHKAAAKGFLPAAQIIEKHRVE